MATVTRGVRNNNPGNIRKGQPWQGLASPAEMTAAQQSETEFDVFKGPEWGIRALARTLITYQDSHGLKSVSEIISRWAPPSENATGAYIQAVARAMLVRNTDKISVHDYAVMRPMVEAIVAHENAGYRYPAAVIDKGLILAGIEAPARAIVNRAGNTAKTVVTATAGGAAFIGAAADGLQQIAPAVPVVRELADLPAIALAVVAGVAVIGLIVWLVMRRR